MSRTISLVPGRKSFTSTYGISGSKDPARWPRGVSNVYCRSRPPGQPTGQGHVLPGGQLRRPPHATFDGSGVLAAVLGDEPLDDRAVRVVEEHAVAVQGDEFDLPHGCLRVGPDAVVRMW